MNSQFMGRSVCPSIRLVFRQQAGIELCSWFSLVSSSVHCLLFKDNTLPDVQEWLMPVASQALCRMLAAAYLGDSSQSYWKEEETRAASPPLLQTACPGGGGFPRACLCVSLLRASLFLPRVQAKLRSRPP